MAEFKSFQMFLILMIPFTAAVTQHRSFITVRVGDEATLPCKDFKDYQDKCLSTSWIFNYLISAPSVTLFESGKIHRQAASKSDRLRVTEKCSLVIKKVTDEDVGLYTCRQFDESGKQVTNSDIDLSVTYTAVTQHYSSISVRVGDETTLNCSDVKDYQNECLSTTWTFNYLTTGPTVTLFEYGEIHREVGYKSDRLSVTEKCSLVIKKLTDDDDVGHYKCRQVDESGKQLTDYDIDLTFFNGENVATPPQTITTSELPPTTTPTTPTATPTTATTTTTTTTTTKRTTKATKATTRPTTTKTTAKATKATSKPTTTTIDTAADLPAILIPVAVVSAALLIIIVVVIRWRRAKGNNTQLDDNTADPPDGVFYASIRYKKKTKSKARVQGGDDTVTYSTLNTSSTSAGASTDPRKLYASINKTRT